MRIILATLLLFLLFIDDAYSLDYQDSIEKKEKVIKCSNFSIRKITSRLPYSINERDIPRELTMGHYTDPYLVSEQLFYIRSGEAVNIGGLTDRLPNYKKIEQKRPYIVSSIQCLGDSSVIFRLWGGGNCDNVCVAIVKADFNDKGDISSISGLTYKEYKEYKYLLAGKENNK